MIPIGRNRNRAVEINLRIAIAPLSRLTKLKEKWDPQNLFRMKKNIAPAS